MIYSSFLMFIIALFVAIEIYFLGKYISKTSSIFKFNEAGSIAMGAVLYFVVTFVVFFIFVWVQPSILYFVVVFIIKEIIQVMFLILRRDVFKGMKVNWFLIIISVISMVSMPLIMNYGLNDLLHLKESTQSNDFQTWQVYKSVISEFTKVEYSYIVKWLSSAIASLVIYNVVASFIIQFSKKKNWVDYVLSLFLTLGLIMLFNFGHTIDSMVGIFLLLFAVQLSVHIIMKARRRFAVMFGLVDVALWFFDPHLFLAAIVLSAVVILLYTFMRKNKASLFLVQMTSPLLILSSLWLYPISTAGALVVVIFAILAYLFIVSAGRNETLGKVNKYMAKYRIILPIIVSLSVIISGSIIFTSSEINISEMFLFNDAIFESFNNDVWNDIQKYSIYPLIIILSSIAGMIWIGKKEMINIKIAFIIGTLALVFGYNAFLNAITNESQLKNQFAYIRVIIFMPISIVPFIIGRRSIKI